MLLKNLSTIKFKIQTPFGFFTLLFQTFFFLIAFITFPRCSSRVFTLLFPSLHTRVTYVDDKNGICSLIFYSTCLSFHNLYSSFFFHNSQSVESVCSRSNPKIVVILILLGYSRSIKISRLLATVSEAQLTQSRLFHRALA